jgi:hypothetical protein
MAAINKRRPWCTPPPHHHHHHFCVNTPTAKAWNGWASFRLPPSYFYLKNGWHKKKIIKKKAPEFHLKNGAGCRGIQPRKSGHCTILPPHRHHDDDDDDDDVSLLHHVCFLVPLLLHTKVSCSSFNHLSFFLNYSSASDFFFKFCHSHSSMDFKPVENWILSHLVSSSSANMTTPRALDFCESRSMMRS